MWLKQFREKDIKKPRMPWLGTRGILVETAMEYSEFEGWLWQWLNKEYNSLQKVCLYLLYFSHLCPNFFLKFLFIFFLQQQILHRHKFLRLLCGQRYANNSYALRFWAFIFSEKIFIYNRQKDGWTWNLALPPDYGIITRLLALIVWSAILAPQTQDMVIIEH